MAATYVTAQSWKTSHYHLLALVIHDNLGDYSFKELVSRAVIWVTKVRAGSGKRRGKLSYSPRTGERIQSAEGGN